MISLSKKLPNLSLTICFIGLVGLSAGSQAYVIQTASENTNALSPLKKQPTFAEISERKHLTATEIQNVLLNFSQDSAISLVNLPSVALQPEFPQIAYKHSVLVTDPSKRFTAPEPSAWIMMIVGLLGLILVRRKNRD